MPHLLFAMTPEPSALEGTPRIALFIPDNKVHAQMVKILREHYSSLLIITEREKFKDFTIPLIVIVSSVAEAAKIQEFHPVEGTRILVVSNALDGETTAAAFEVGAVDYLAYPLRKEEVIEKTEKYLESFRRQA